MTRPPNRSSNAALISGGRSSRWTRTPLAGIGLEKDASPKLEVVIDPPLDRVAHVVGKRHHEVLVLGGLQRKMRDLDRRMEFDAPLARQGDHAKRTEPRPERRDREIRQTEEPCHGPEVADHRVDLLGADD